MNEQPIKVVGDLRAELALGKSQDEIGVTVDGHGCELVGVDRVVDFDPSFTTVYLRVKSSKQWRDARKDHRIQELEAEVTSLNDAKLLYLQERLWSTAENDDGQAKT